MALFIKKHEILVFFTGINSILTICRNYNLERGIPCLQILSYIFGISHNSIVMQEILRLDGKLLNHFGRGLTATSATRYCTEKKRARRTCRCERARKRVYRGYTQLPAFKKNE